MRPSTLPHVSSSQFYGHQQGQLGSAVYSSSSMAGQKAPPTVSSAVSTARPRFVTPSSNAAPVVMAQPYALNTSHPAMQGTGSMSPNGSFSASPPTVARMGNPSIQNASPIHPSSGLAVDGSPNIVMARRVPASTVPASVNKQTFASGTGVGGAQQQQTRHRSPSAGSTSVGVSGLRGTSVSTTTRALSPSLLAGTKASASRREATNKQLMASDAMRRRARMVDGGHVPPAESSTFTNNRLMGWGVGLTSAKQYDLLGESRAPTKASSRATSPSASRTATNTPPPSWNSDVKLPANQARGSTHYESAPFISRHHDASANSSRQTSRSGTPQQGAAARGVGRSRKFAEPSAVSGSAAYEDAFTPSDYMLAGQPLEGMPVPVVGGTSRRSVSPSASQSSPQPSASRTSFSIASVTAERDHFKTLAVQCRQVIESQGWKIDQLERRLNESNTEEQTMPKTRQNAEPVRVEPLMVDFGVQETDDSRDDEINYLRRQITSLEVDREAVALEAAQQAENQIAEMSSLKAKLLSLEGSCERLQEELAEANRQNRRLAAAETAIPVPPHPSDAELRALGWIRADDEAKQNSDERSKSIHSAAELEEDIQFVLGCINDLVDWVKVQHQEENPSSTSGPSFIDDRASVTPFVPRTVIITGKTLTSSQYSAHLKAFMANQQALSDAFQHISHVNEKEHRRRIEVEDALQKGIVALELATAKEAAAVKALAENRVEVERARATSTSPRDPANHIDASLQHRLPEAYELLQRPAFIAATESEKDALFRAFQEDLDRQRLQLLAQHDEEVRGVKAAWEVEDLRLREEIIRLEGMLDTSAAQVITTRDSSMVVAVPAVSGDKQNIVSDLEKEIRKLKSELKASKSSENSTSSSGTEGEGVVVSQKANAPPANDQASTIAALTVEIKVAKVQITDLEDKLKVSNDSLAVATSALLAAREDSIKESTLAAASAGAVTLIEAEAQQLRMQLAANEERFELAKAEVKVLKATVAQLQAEASQATTHNDDAERTKQIEAIQLEAARLTGELSNATANLNILQADKELWEQERLAQAQSQEQLSRVVFELRSAKMAAEGALAEALESNKPRDASEEPTHDSHEDTIKQLEATHQAELSRQRAALEESHQKALLGEEEQWAARLQAQASRLTEEKCKELARIQAERSAEVADLREELSAADESLQLLEVFRAEMIALRAKASELEEQLLAATSSPTETSYEEELVALREQLANMDTLDREKSATIDALISNQHSQEEAHVKGIEGLRQQLAIAQSEHEKYRTDQETKLRDAVTSAIGAGQEVDALKALLLEAQRSAESEKATHDNATGDLTLQIEALKAELLAAHAQAHQSDSAVISDMPGTPPLLNSTAAEFSGTIDAAQEAKRGDPIVARLTKQVQNLEEQLAELKLDKHRLEQQLAMADAEREELAAELEYAAIEVESHLTTPRAGEAQSISDSRSARHDARHGNYLPPQGADPVAEQVSRALSSRSSQYLEQEY